jgi:hypothetical protein
MMGLYKPTFTSLEGLLYQPPFFMGENPTVSMAAPSLPTGKAVHLWASLDFWISGKLLGPSWVSLVAKLKSHLVGG